MIKQELINNLKKEIISELNLEGITPDDIDDKASLFGETLSLDSIDALELVYILDKYHNVNIPDEETGRVVLNSIDSMADYIIQNTAD